MVQVEHSVQYVCVSVRLCVRTISVEQNDFWPCWLILTLSRLPVSSTWKSRSQIKVHGKMRKTFLFSNWCWLKSESRVGIMQAVMTSSQLQLDYQLLFSSWLFVEFLVLKWSVRHRVGVLQWQLILADVSFVILFIVLRLKFIVYKRNWKSIDRLSRGWNTLSLWAMTRRCLQYTHYRIKQMINSHQVSQTSRCFVSRWCF